MNPTTIVIFPFGIHTVCSYCTVHYFDWLYTVSVQLYEEVFEKPLLKETREYYSREAAEIHADCTCSVYIQKVSVVWTPCMLVYQVWNEVEEASHQRDPV